MGAASSGDDITWHRRSPIYFIIRSLFLFSLESTKSSSSARNKQAAMAGMVDRAASSEAGGCSGNGTPSSAASAQLLALSQQHSCTGVGSRLLDSSSEVVFRCHLLHACLVLYLCICGLGLAFFSSYEKDFVSLPWRRSPSGSAPSSCLATSHVPPSRSTRRIGTLSSQHLAFRAFHWFPLLVRFRDPSEELCRSRSCYLE